jgi:hypothetical protein
MGHGQAHGMDRGMDRETDKDKDRDRETDKDKDRDRKTDRTRTRITVNEIVTISSMSHEKSANYVINIVSIKWNCHKAKFLLQKLPHHWTFLANIVVQRKNSIGNCGNCHTAKVLAYWTLSQISNVFLIRIFSGVTISDKNLLLHINIRNRCYFINCHFARCVFFPLCQFKEKCHFCLSTS